MSPQEFDQLLHDAEVKLARLKALYEQYFQGIEKMEPSVARKDLDRSFEILKKNVPRNTALRFRMQQLIARYGTYGIYWGRITRQIEEGTFKRDLVRVHKKHARAEKKQAAEAWEIDVELDESVDDLPDDRTDPNILPGAPGASASSPPGAKSAMDFDDGDLDAILGALGAPEEKQKAKPVRSLSPFAMGSTPPKPAAAVATFGKPIDRGAAKPAAPAAAAGAPAAGAPAAAPTSPAAPAVAKPAVPGAPAAPGAPPGAPRPLSPLGSLGMARPALGAAKPAAPGAAPSPPAPPSPPAAPPSAAKPAAPPVVAKPVAPPIARPPAPGASPVAAPRPAAPAPPRPQAAAPQAAAARPAPSAPTAAELDERRMRAIYANYADARRKNNEPEIRYETMAASVEKMMPKLREKHGAKAIDFEVVMQNGKVGLKPKVGG